MFAVDSDRKTRDALRKYIPNYRMNLIDAGHMEEAQLKKFGEDLQQVFGMLKCSKQEKGTAGIYTKERKVFQ